MPEMPDFKKLITILFSRNKNGSHVTYELHEEDTHWTDLLESLSITLGILFAGIQKEYREGGGEMTDDELWESFNSAVRAAMSNGREAVPSDRTEYFDA